MISYAFPKKVVDASEDHLFSLVLPSGRIPLLLQGLTTAFFNPLVSGRFGFVPVAACGQQSFREAVHASRFGRWGISSPAGGKSK